MVLRVTLAGLVALLVLLGVACLPATPAPTLEAPFRPEDRPAVAIGDAGPAGRRERVRVYGAGSQMVNLRAEASTMSPRLKGLIDGVQLELVGEDRTADGRTWRNARDPSDGMEGWVSADFLAPVADP